MGSKVLKICSVLMIIGAAVVLVISLLALLGLGTLMGLAAEDMATGFGIAAVFMVIASLGAILQLVAGILGVRNWNNPAKAQSCIVMGIVILVINIISQIGNIANSQSAGNAVFYALLGLVLPVLYLVGAFQLKKQA